MSASRSPIIWTRIRRELLALEDPSDQIALGCASSIEFGSVDLVEEMAEAEVVEDLARVYVGLRCHHVEF